MQQIIKKNIQNKLKIDPNKNKKILICGLTYKQNVADLRNSLPLKIFKDLKSKKLKGYDSLIEKNYVENRFNYKYERFMSLIYI